MLTTTAGGRACSDRTSFNLGWDRDRFGNKVYTSTILKNCGTLDANRSDCSSDYNFRYNLSNTENGQVKLSSCKMDSHFWSANPYCNEDEDNQCRPPVNFMEGNKISLSDYYATLNPKTNQVSLGFAPCGWNQPRFGGRMKNPDTKAGSLDAWSDASKVCNKVGIDPQNDKCKHYKDTISCERRASKEDCEQVESGCSMFESSSCCSWNNDTSKCSKNTKGCNRHSTFGECNADPSKMCRWGPDISGDKPLPRPGCYPNKGWQDSYLNTLNNTCRSPQFIGKNIMWARTGEKDENGFSKCELTPPGKGPTVRYFGSKEECEGKIPLPIPEPPLPAPPPPPPPPPPSYKFSCLNTGHTQNCTAIPSWTEGIQSFPTKVECQLGTNYCGKGTDVVSSFTCLNTGHGKHCTQIPQGVPEGDLETFPTLLDCQVGTDYCGNGP